MKANDVARASAGGGPRTVVHVITRFDVGGAQATVRSIVEGLDRTRFTPVVMSGVDDGDARAPIPMRRALADSGIRIVDVPSLHRSVGPSEFNAIRDVRVALDHLRPALVHTHSSKAGVIGRIAATSAEVPAIVHTVHGWSFHEGQARPVIAAVAALERRMAHRCDALVVVCEHDRRLGRLHRIGSPGQYEVIRSGIDVDAIARGDDARREARERVHVPPDCPVVMWGGRYAPQKDPLTLVRVIASVVDRRPEVMVVLAGDGPMEVAVQREIHALGLDRSVRRLGSRPDLPSLWAAADVALLTSRWEGLPRTVVEAALAGASIAATDVGGVREIVADHRCGCLRSPGDVGGLTEDILGLLRHPRSLDSAALTRVGDEFAITAMVDATQRLYERLLNRSNSVAA